MTLRNRIKPLFILNQLFLKLIKFIKNNKKKNLQKLKIVLINRIKPLFILNH